MRSRVHLHIPTNLGDRAADAVVATMGSWRFVIVQTLLVALWITVNVWFLIQPFDPVPFIGLNLLFSVQAAYASPLILMASNRQSSKDRARDSLEADEVDQLFTLQKDLAQINDQQYEILTLLRDHIVRDDTTGTV